MPRKKAVKIPPSVLVIQRADGCYADGNEGWSRDYGCACPYNDLDAAKEDLLNYAAVGIAGKYEIVANAGMGCETVLFTHVKELPAEGVATNYPEEKQRVWITVVWDTGESRDATFEPKVCASETQELGLKFIADEYITQLEDLMKHGDDGTVQSHLKSAMRPYKKDAYKRVVELARDWGMDSRQYQRVVVTE